MTTEEILRAEIERLNKKIVDQKNVFIALMLSGGIDIQIRKATVLSDERCNAVRDMFLAGKSQREIGSALGLTSGEVTWVEQHLRSKGEITVRDKKIDTQYDEAVIKLHREGKTQREIADELGVTMNRINCIEQRFIRSGVLKMRSAGRPNRKNAKLNQDRIVRIT